MSRTLHVSEPLRRWHSEGLFHPFPITQMCFTPDGRGLLAADGGGDVRRWDAAAWRGGTGGTGGEVVNAAPKDQPRGVALALSPRGDVVATVDYAAFTLRPGDGSAARTFEVGTPLQRPAAAALTPDASALAVGGWYRGGKGMAYALWVWDTGTGEERFRVKLKGEPQRLVFAPDGSWLAAIVDDKPIHLFDARSGEVLATLKVGSSGPDRLIVSDDGRRLAAAGYGTIRVWDTATRELVKQKKVKAGGAGSEEVSDIAFLPGGREIAACDGRGSFLFLETDTLKTLRSITTPRFASSINALAVAPDAATLVVQCGSALHPLDAGDGRRLREMSGHVSGIIGLDFDAAGERLLTYDYAEQGFIWSVDGSPPRRLNLAKRERVDQYDEYQYAALSPDGRTVASAGRRMLRLWDVQSGRLIHELPEGIGHPRPLRFSPDGRWLAYHDERPVEGRSPGDWCLDVLDLDTGEVRRRLEQRDAIGDVSFSPDGQLMAAVTGYGLQLVRTAGDEEPRLVYDPRQRDHLVGGFSWSADGTRVSSLATGADTAGPADASGVSRDDLVLCTWDVDTGEVVDARVLPGKQRQPGVPGVPGNVPVSVVASSAGTFVLRDELDLPPTSRDGRLVDLAGGEVIVRNLREMQVYSGGMTLSGDGRRLAAALGNHSVAVWDLSEAAATLEDWPTRQPHPEHDRQRAWLEAKRGEALAAPAPEAEATESADGQTLAATAAEAITPARRGAATRKANAFLKELDAVGWFDSLPQEARDHVRDAARDAVLAEEPLHTALFAVEFDSESIYGESDYENLIADFAHASFGLFPVTDLDEKWTQSEEPTITLKFTVNGKTFRGRWGYESDYVDDAFYELLEKAQSAMEGDARFIACNGGDQIVYYALTSPEAARRAMAAGLLPR